MSPGPGVRCEDARKRAQGAVPKREEWAEIDVALHPPIHVMQPMDGPDGEHVTDRPDAVIHV
jgi:hypothetical protein